MLAGLSRPGVRHNQFPKNTEDYDCAIEKFKVDTKTPPVFIPTMCEGSMKMTICAVAVEFNDTVSLMSTFQ